MQKNKKRSSYIQIVCALSLFLLFSVCSLFLVTIGANNYKGILGETDKSFNTNASLHYVTNKLHSYDKRNGVSIERINGVQIFALNEDLSESGYHTLIYYYDGYLYELLKQKQQPFVIGNGTKILPVENFSVKKLTNNLVQITATNKNSEKLSTKVSLKCAEMLEVYANAKY